MGDDVTLEWNIIFHKVTFGGIQFDAGLVNMKEDLTYVGKMVRPHL